MPLFLGLSEDFVDPRKLFFGKGRSVQDGEIVQDLLGPARADQSGGHRFVPQGPLKGQMVELLSPLVRDFFEGADLSELFLGQSVGL